jgi:endo-1,4-beta-xylanase
MIAPHAACIALALAGTACGTSQPATGTLAERAAAHDIRIGTFLFGTTGPDADEGAFASALAEVNTYIAPVFFRLIEPHPGEYDFSLADAVADAAPPDAMLYVPGILTNDLIPGWLTAQDPTGAQLRPILIDLVQRVVAHFEGRFPGRVMAYEIVLEPLSWQDRGGLWNRIGLDAGLDRYEYIRLAYRTARAVAPQATLAIDDFGVEAPGAKADAYYELVRQLVAGGTPIDDVAVEGHFMLGTDGAFPAPPEPDDFAANLDRFGGLGLRTMITSVDISLPDADVSPATLAAQAEAYSSVSRACRTSDTCRMLATWGLGDADSWIPQSFPGWGSPLLYDAHYVRKPAYFAVRDAL